MKLENPLKNAPFETLPQPYADEPSAGGMEITPPVRNLVETQVRALVESSPNFHNLSSEQKQQIYRDMVKINSYTASLLQEDWALSKKLGQTPVLHEEAIFQPMANAANGSHIENPVFSDVPSELGNGAPSKALEGEGSFGTKKVAASPKAEEFSPRAASEVAKITRQTLNAIAFPTFVADLIKGTFQAIVNASIQQMEAYGNLLANVAKTVDQFMGDNITDNQSRDYLASRYPSHFRIETSDDSARVRAKETDLPNPDFKTDFGLSSDVSIDDDSAEEILVPAARRKLAQQRHSMLSTMVLMGINRIVVTSGKIKAQMGFRIDAKDHATAESASKFDARHEDKIKTGFGGGLASFLGGPSGSIEQKNTVTYVSSNKKDSSDELDVHADLTGEVELKFKSDYFPMERFADPQMLSLIQGNTPNPAANSPNTGTDTNKGNQANKNP